MGFQRQGGIQRLGPSIVLRPNRGALERTDVDASDAGRKEKRMLVVGGSGMLGHRVADVARVHRWEVAAAGRDVVDVADLEATTAALERLRPDVVVNCAAWTDVDGAEEHEAEALAVNGTGAQNLARATAAIGARIVHVSTDYVFDGAVPADASPLAEDHPTGPRGAYGRTKLAGERAVAADNPNHLICRTAWLFGAGGGNFVDTMLRLGGERDELQVVDDQTGCPTWTGHLAPALVRAAESDATGVCHLAGAGRVTWHGLAHETFALAGMEVDTVPVTTDAFPRPAPRPAWSVLAANREDVPRLPDWREGLRGHLAERGVLRG